jgi:threonine dehydratase
MSSAISSTTSGTVSGMSGGLTWELIEQARQRIAGKVNLTPVMSSSTLDGLTGARLSFKCENFQKGGAFKARGANNAVFALPETEARRGVATHSSGNHGAAVARAAALRGIRAYVVMPDNTAHAKRAAVSRYGAEITWCAPTLAARESTVQKVIAATGATLIHPYDDLLVMAGQATAAVELLAAVPTIDVLLAPVGGGGLLSGSAVAAKTIKPAIRVIGVEPAGADDAARSLRAFAEIRRLVDDIITVPDAAIVRAMRQMWEVLKIVVEPSAAVPYAALLEAPAALRARRIGVIVSGGNLDLDHLPWSEPA